MYGGHARARTHARALLPRARARPGVRVHTHTRTCIQCCGNPSAPSRSARSAISARPGSRLTQAIGARVRLVSRPLPAGRRKARALRPKAGPPPRPALVKTRGPCSPLASVRSRKGKGSGLARGASASAMSDAKRAGLDNPVPLQPAPCLARPASRSLCLRDAWAGRSLCLRDALVNRPFRLGEASIGRHFCRDALGGGPFRLLVGSHQPVFPPSRGPRGGAAFRFRTGIRLADRWRGPSRGRRAAAFRPRRGVASDSNSLVSPPFGGVAWFCRARRLASSGVSSLRAASPPERGFPRRLFYDSAGASGAKRKRLLAGSGRNVARPRRIRRRRYCSFWSPIGADTRCRVVVNRATPYVGQRRLKRWL